MEKLKKKVRILLRVSSDQQLEADGDLGIQRQLVIEEIQKHSDWILDSKEYFEGSNSGYKNSVDERNILQEALTDAQNKEYDILVAYKDDRLGRRMLEIPIYIMELKKSGVDVYTVKDKLLTPNYDDITGMMMLVMRYGMAQKSSSDTGMRVKDTAQKLVQQGKFMGGKAPYGYTLEYSGEYSKHQRALKHLVIVPERAEVVRHIYELSFYKEFGSAKIARTLNLDEKYRDLAPNDVWKAGTIASILTNPIYTGHTAYKRRERINGKYRSLDSKDWIISEKPNEDIIIVDKELWQKVQLKMDERNGRYHKRTENEGAVVISRNDGNLALIDVAYCGYCGRKLTNGTKYDYWTIKGTGERRTSKKAIYRCQGLWQGIPHRKMKIIHAEQVEPIIFEALANYISKLQENENVFEQIVENQNSEKKRLEKKLSKEKEKLERIRENINIMESNVPIAMAGKFSMSLEYLVELLNKQKENYRSQEQLMEQVQNQIHNTSISIDDWETLRKKIPTWREVFLKADTPTKRVLVDKLISRIDITEEQVIIRFKINLDEFGAQPRITNNERVQEQEKRLHHHFLDGIRP